MAREITAYGFTCGQYLIPAGASSALFVTPAPGEVMSIVKYFGGGSLELIGASMPGSTGVVTAGTGYLFGAAEALQFDGAARYFLCATGSTVTAYFTKALSQGF